MNLANVEGRCLSFISSGCYRFSHAVAERSPLHQELKRAFHTQISGFLFLWEIFAPGAKLHGQFVHPYHTAVAPMCTYGQQKPHFVFKEELLK